MCSAHNKSFSLSESRYDLRTFGGRLLNFLEVTDPRTLLVRGDELNRSLHLLQAFKLGNQDILRGVTDEDLWRARKIKESMVHPDTGEIIWRPFRMAGYVPYGTPIVLFMLIPATTNSLMLTAVAQTLNQSHNAAVNYANRSATKGEGGVRDIVRGYSAAVSCAMSISLGANILVNRSRVSPNIRKLLKTFIPWPAVCCASVSNMVLMRYAELSSGIPIFDERTGDEIGVSKMAAENAIRSTAIVRFVLASCAVGGPQLLYALTEKRLSRFPKLLLPAQAIYTLVCFGLGVPLSLALFSPTVVCAASTLEKELQAVKRSDGTIVTTVRYNKGL